jgi:hypothetical protein
MAARTPAFRATRSVPARGRRPALRPVVTSIAARPFLLVFGVVVNTMATAAPPPNYDESKVPAHVLPEVLAGPDGLVATTVAAWQTAVRPHQFGLLERHVYGRRLPPTPVTPVGDVERAAVTLADGAPATRMQARLRLGPGDDARIVDVLLYLPPAGTASPTRVPVFLELNFRGNHSQHADPGIRLSTAWMPKDDAAGIVDHRATEASRGHNARRWPVEALLARGFGMATAYCGDIFPDRPDGRPESVLASLGRPVDGPLPPDEPGAIGAWAWGLSRILDWLVTLPEVDPRRVIVVGHSRLGKTALWAGACDERFALVVSNDSGCGGAALSRRAFGETVEVITQRFPHWFCPAFAGYAGREGDLPCDQHTLLAMTAPRPLYVASATEDLWADPRGEFLAAVAAEPVWRLFGLQGLGVTEPPPPDVSVGGSVAYHTRTGRHDILLADWTFFADFAARTLPAAP